MTAKDLGTGYARWARKFGVDKHVKLGWEVVGGGYYEKSSQWTVRVRKMSDTQEKQSSDGSSTTGDQATHMNGGSAADEPQEATILCKHLVLATGPGGHTPSLPHLPNRDLFPGVALHSASFTNSSDYAGLKGLVIGTANTAHDIAEDMLHHSLSSITMLQRRVTYVLPTEYFTRIAERSYNEEIPTEVADQEGMSMPWGIARLLAMKGLHGQAAQESERFDALGKVGYGVERYGDIMWHITERMGGHYMDMGSCEKIAKGEIKVRGGVPKSWTERGLIVDVGEGREEEVEADVVVFATGFERGGKAGVERLFGREVAERCGDFWGVDEEGELRGAWKRSGREYFPAFAVPFALN